MVIEDFGHVLAPQNPKRFGTARIISPQGDAKIWGTRSSQIYTPIIWEPLVLIHSNFNVWSNTKRPTTSANFVKSRKSYTRQWGVYIPKVGKKNWHNVFSYWSSIYPIPEKLGWNLVPRSDHLFGALLHANFHAHWGNVLRDAVAGRKTSKSLLSNGTSRSAHCCR